MTPEQLDAIRTRLNAATPAERWLKCSYGETEDGELFSCGPIHDPNDFEDSDDSSLWEKAADAAQCDQLLLNHAPTDIAALLDTIRLADSVIAKLGTALGHAEEEIAQLKQSSARGGRIFTEGKVR
jgi:hypothetical protein